MEKIITFLTINDDYSIIGSAADKKLKYSSDVDVQEYIELEGQTDEILNNIYQLFKKKYKEAYQNDSVFITDFKLGVLEHNAAIKWTRKDINQGYVDTGNRKITFKECLLQKSVIKIDIVHYEDNMYKEYSVNYYFLINEHSTNPFITDKDLVNEFVLEYYKYMKEKNYFKALKRLYSLYKIIKKPAKQLISFLNSDVGKMNHKKTSLEVILGLLDNNFRKPKMRIVKKAIKKIDKKYAKFDKKDIEEQINTLQLEINIASQKFINENVNILDILKNSKR